MENAEIIKSQNPKEGPTKKGKFQRFFSGFFREFIAIFLWGYTTIKLFIFDIDIFLIERFFPRYAWIVQYKFFILIGIAAIVWFTTKNKTIILWGLFIFFYPLIIFIWKIPFLIYKLGSWDLAFAYIDSIISFIKSFRITFITGAIFLISTAIILAVSNNAILWASIILIAIILLVVYVQRIFLVLKPSGIYQTYVRFFSFAGTHTLNIYGKAIVDENASKVPVESMDEKQIEKWKTNVQQLVLFNRFCLFVAKGLKSYRESGINFVSYIFNILILFLYTVFSFALINYGLFKIDNNLYLLSNVPTFFTFFYYSFNLMFFNSIQEIIAIAPMSQFVLMVEYIYALFLVAIFVSLIFSVKSQKYAEELNDAIEKLTKEGLKIEEHMRDQYELNSIVDALEALRKLKSSFVDFLYTITKTIG